MQNRITQECVEEREGKEKILSIEAHALKLI